MPRTPLEPAENPQPSKSQLLEMACFAASQSVERFIRICEAQNWLLPSKEQCGLIHRLFFEGQILAALNAANFAHLGADLTNWLHVSHEEIDAEIRKTFPATIGVPAAPKV